MSRFSPQASQHLLGRYAIFGEIASGGMAAVHYGRLLGPAGFSRTVAIKRLHPHFAHNPEFVAMFLDEARLAARVHHPNVVSTLDVIASEGEVFLIMDFILGESLSRLLYTLETQKQKVPPAIAVHVMSGVLQGLHAAHEAVDDRGQALCLVHRDISPPNILIGVDGVARILDFGIAKAVSNSQQTEQGILKGKIGYLAPEQLRDGAVDRRVDIYAASVVLWEMLTGRKLFKASAAESLLHQILNQPLEPPSQHAPGLDPALDQIVLRGLSRDPAERFATAREMALALEESLTPATGSQVGSWVETLAGAAIGARAQKVAEIESGFQASESQSIPTAGSLMQSSPGSSAHREAPTTPQPKAHAQVAEPVATSTPSPTTIASKGKRTALIAIVVGVAAVGALAGLSALKSAPSGPKPPAAPGSASAKASASALASSTASAAPSPGVCGQDTAALTQVSALFAGPSSRHTCALKQDKTVWCWGDNRQAQLGLGTTEPASIATAVRKLAQVQALSVGNTETCALQQDHTVACWGKNLLLKPTTVLGLANVASVAVGGGHACATESAGALWCWGENERGQLGSARKDAALAVQVERLPKALAVSVGSTHSCAISPSDHTVWCWGDNSFGQLGEGTTDRLVHVKAQPVRGVPPAVQLAAGDKTTFAVTEQGAVFGWGFGIKKPVRVLIDSVQQVAAGAKQSCALKKDGSVWCWGFNDFGQLGSEATEDSASPVQVKGLSAIKSIAVGELHACALTSMGAVWCWGANDQGQLGLGSSDRERHPKPTPVQAAPCP